MEKMTEDPSLLQKGINLSKYTWQLMNYIQQNPQSSLTVSDKVYKERISICRSCDKFKEIENECKECGCYIPAKARIILDSCPIDKWGMDQSDWESRFASIKEGIDNSIESE